MEGAFRQIEITYCVGSSEVETNGLDEGSEYHGLGNGNFSSGGASSTARQLIF